jgi:hypothetical protein
VRSFRVSTKHNGLFTAKLIVGGYTQATHRVKLDLSLAAHSSIGVSVRLQPLPILIILLGTTACRDRELASPYTSLLSRHEAEVVAGHMRIWAGNVARGADGEGPEDPSLLPPAGYTSGRCWKGGRMYQTWNHKRTWNDSTRSTVIDSKGRIDQDECSYYKVKDVAITISAKESLTYSLHKQFDGKEIAGLYYEHFQGGFRWNIDRRHGKCAIDFVYSFEPATWIEKRTGHVCGHLFAETNDLSRFRKGD